jgi:hypothetical protein
MAYIISSDDVKETLPGYNPLKAEEFHKKSTNIADKMFEDALKSRTEKTVIIMSGGSASGKSEYVSAYLYSRKVMIYDGTSSTYARAKGKLEKALRSDKRVEAHAVWPESFERAFLAFTYRDRQFSVKHFYRTHSNSRKTLLKIAKEFSNVPIKLTLSDYRTSEPKMTFSVLTEKSRIKFIEYLQDNQYTENEIMARVIGVT